MPGTDLPRDPAVSSAVKRGRQAAPAGSDQRPADTGSAAPDDAPYPVQADDGGPTRTIPADHIDGAGGSDEVSGVDDATDRLPAENGWKRGLAGSLAFLRRRLAGDYTVDEFGYDPDFTDHVLVPPLKLLYEKWFRIETLGMENIPDTGGALLVANHSGTIAIDAVMTAVAVREHHPQHRPLRMLGADLVFETPFLGPISRRAGNTLACNPDAERLLSSGELVAVYPEGFKGVGKPYSQRYKLQRFGRGGFVTAALRTGVPIIPVSIVGAEEIYPLIGNLRPLARALGLPYFPVTPTFPLLGPLGAIPLPSKWIIEFGEPIPTGDYPDNAADDPMVVFNLTDRVRETIQQTLYRLLLRRGHPFLG